MAIPMPTLRPLAAVLDQMLVPLRLANRAIVDLGRIADGAAAVGALADDARRELRSLPGSFRHAVATLDSVRDELAALRTGLEPMSDDLDALRTAFAATTEELARLRAEVIPELGGVRGAAGGLHQEVRRQRELIDELQSTLEATGRVLGTALSTLIETLKPLVRDVDEVREVVEPLQSATERVGRLAERLPGPGRKD